MLADAQPAPTLSVRQGAASVRRVETASPVAARVGANIRHFRALRGVSVRELSARLGELGRPILPSGITKLEKGGRRVDVDELIALAVALGVNPNALLLLPYGQEDSKVQLIDSVTVSWHRAWGWATGDVPLDGPARPSERVQWFEISKPHRVDELKIDDLIDQAHETHRQDNVDES